MARQPSYPKDAPVGDSAETGGDGAPERSGEGCGGPSI
jgi:hypothetical protein